MEKLYAYTMVSRNKDNKGVPGFKQRTKSYLCYESEEEKSLIVLFQMASMVRNQDYTNQ